MASCVIRAKAHALPSRIDAGDGRPHVRETRSGAKSRQLVQLIFTCFSARRQRNRRAMSRRARCVVRSDAAVRPAFRGRMAHVNATRMLTPRMCVAVPAHTCATHGNVRAICATCVPPRRVAARVNGRSLSFLRSYRCSHDIDKRLSSGVEHPSDVLPYSANATLVLKYALTRCPF